MSLYSSGSRLESGPASPTSPCSTLPVPAAAPVPEPELDDDDPPLLYPGASGDRERVIVSSGELAVSSVAVVPVFPPSTTFASGTFESASPADLPVPASASLLSLVFLSSPDPA